MPSNVVTPILSRLALLILGGVHLIGYGLAVLTVRQEREPPNQVQSVGWT